MVIVEGRIVWERGKRVCGRRQIVQGWYLEVCL
jgi:hypothetical protein